MYWEESPPFCWWKVSGRFRRATGLGRMGARVAGMKQVESHETKDLGGLNPEPDTLPECLTAGHKPKIDNFQRGDRSQFFLRTAVDFSRCRSSYIQAHALSREIGRKKFESHWAVAESNDPTQPS